MRKYNVNVNGTAYEVTVEEVTGAAASAPVAAPAPAAAPAPVAAAPAGAGTEVTAPMPGNVLSVNVTVGQHVEAGTAVVVLEAMKMENEIPAPISGTVTSVAVTKGATVAGGAVLCTIA